MQVFTLRIRLFTSQAGTLFRACDGLFAASKSFVYFFLIYFSSFPTDGFKVPTLQLGLSPFVRFFIYFVIDTLVL